VEAVLRSTPETPAPMIGMSHNMITSTPLMDAVKLVLFFGIYKLMVTLTNPA
jgi:hypothetical protein